MIIAVAALVTIVVMAFLLIVRAKDLPKPLPVSPFQHLDERKATIYDNLRDLQFEYRLGKLSDQDYQQTKVDLQKELAAVMAEADRIKAAAGSPQAVPATAPVKRSEKKQFVCPSCGAEFSQPLKFCGECGKPMKVRA